MGKLVDGAMVRLGTLLSLVLTFTICSSGAGKQVSTTSKSLGLIALSKNYSNRDFIHIYNEDGSLWHRFSFYYNDNNGKFEYANEDFRPFAFHPDYFLLALRCFGKEAGRYEVVVNEETGLKKYVKADDPSLRFETWEDHILNVFSVSFNQEENPVLQAPQGQVKKVALSGGIPFFHPVEVKGEWLKVKWEISDRTRNKAPKYDSGWIKWKEDEGLLVELFYFA